MLWCTLDKNVIRRFIRAKTPEQLEVEQKKLNELFNTGFEYGSFYFVRGWWYTDFLIDAQMSENILKRMRRVKK